MLHGHLDVVPAEASDWSVHPFSGARRGRLRVGSRRDRHEGHGRHDDRGRPALQTLRHRAAARPGVRASCPTRRPGGKYGCKWLVENRPDLFEGVTEAVGEVGGFSLTIPRREGGERTLYLIETAEKAMMWMRLTARGRAGHGSMIHDNNAVTAVAEATAKLGRHQFPVVLTDSVEQFLAAVAEETGLHLRRGLAGSGGRDRQARPDRPDRRRDAARHRQPHDAQGRVQGQRHPGDGGGRDRLPCAARPAGGVRAGGRRDHRPRRHPRMDHRPAVV